MTTYDNDTGEVIDATPQAKPRKVKVDKVPKAVKSQRVSVAAHDELAQRLDRLFGIPQSVERKLVRAARSVAKHRRQIQSVGTGALIGVGVFAAIEIISRMRK